MENNVMKLKKKGFLVVLKIALDYMKEENTIIQNDFKGCGLEPFNPNAVDYDVDSKKKVNQKVVSKRVYIKQLKMEVVIRKYI